MKRTLHDFEVQELLDRFSASVGYNKEEAKQAQTIELGLYDLFKQLTLAYRMLDDNQPGLALVVLKALTDQVLPNVRITRKDLFQPHLADLLKVSKHMYGSHDKWVAGTYIPLLKQYESTSLFSGTNLTVAKVPPTTFLQAKRSIDEELFKTWVLHPGQMSSVFELREFVLLPKLVIGDSTTAWFDHVRSLKRTDNQAIVSLFLKLEDRGEFSSFIVGVNFKDWIWISTDMVEFDTPRNKRTTRRPERHRERYWETIDLPYDLGIDPKKWRAKRTDVATPETKNEFFFKDLRDLKLTQRMFLVALTEQLFIDIRRKPFRDQVWSARDYIQTHLLTSSDMKPMEDATEFRHMGEAAKVVVGEMIESVSKITGQSTALVPVVRDVIRSSPEFDPDWLATQEQHNMLTKYFTLSEQTRMYQENLDKLEESSKDDILKVEQSINLDKLIPLIFKGNSVDMWLSGYSGGAFGSGSKFHRIGFVQESIPADKSGWHGYGSMWIGKKGQSKCVFCNKFHPSTVKRIEIYTYSQLMLLMGVQSRFDLPKSLWNYRARMFIPYMGNSILDNVHPYLLLEDPASRANPNGMNVWVFMCKYCHNQFLKKYSGGRKNVVIDVNGSEIQHEEVPGENENFGVRIQW